MIKKKLISSYTLPVKKAIHLVSFDPTTIPIGSFAYKILYPGDIDVREKVIKCCTKQEVIKNITKDIQQIVKNITLEPRYYLAEFKAGLDKRYPNNRDLYIVRWNENEILMGFKILPEGKILKLEDAIAEPTIVKLDIWAPVGGRYVEISNFMILMFQDEQGNIIPLNGEQPDYIESIIKDIETYFSKDNLNAFKATKRMMLLARLYNDNSTLEKILPLINSGAGRLYQVISDMNTISDMILKLKEKAPYDYFYKEIESFKGRLSYINEFDFKEQQIDEQIDMIIKNKLKGADLVTTLDRIINNLLFVLNDYSIYYDSLLGLYPPPKKYQRQFKINY